MSNEDKLNAAEVVTSFSPENGGGHNFNNMFKHEHNLLCPTALYG